MEHIRGLESVARVHEGESGLQVLLCLSAGRDVRERDREQPRAQDGGVQSAGQKKAGQDFQDSFRQDCLHVLHFGFPAGGRGSVEAGMLGNDALSERLYVLFLYKTD